MFSPAEVPTGTSPATLPVAGSTITTVPAPALEMSSMPAWAVMYSKSLPWSRYSTGAAARSKGRRASEPESEAAAQVSAPSVVRAMGPTPAARGAEPEVRSSGSTARTSSTEKQATWSEVQAPERQDSPGRQARPTAPQLARSVSRATQTPALQLAPPAQGVPQAPQLAASTDGSTQAPLQTSSPAGQVISFWQAERAVRVTSRRASWSERLMAFLRWVTGDGGSRRGA